MRRLLLRRGIKLACRSVMRFLDRSVCRAMGCFLHCFRIREDRSTNHIVSNSAQVKFKGVAESENHLPTSYLSEGHDMDDYSPDFLYIDKGLKDEAMFLKACGTIPETPYEIRLASKRFQHRDSQSSEFHSWLPHQSMTTAFQSDEKIDDSQTSVRVCEELRLNSNSLEQTPSSCLSDPNHPGRNSGSSQERGQGSTITTSANHVNDRDQGISSATVEFSAGNTQGRNRSVRFVCEDDEDSPICCSQSSRKLETEGNKRSSAVASPNPTPLKLSDEMQTPGTIFPSNLESFGKGKTRIRSQFVYSVPNPMDSFSLCKLAEESDMSQEPAEPLDSIEQTVAETPRSKIQVNKGEESSSENDSKVEASFSTWLKTRPASNPTNNQNLGDSSRNMPQLGRTPGDRPIIGMVAAHWNGEPPQISPKWCGGNGIPNSTTKYKEDQKVSWHATPFEERLEKALSEETFISQRRRFSGTQMVFDENEGESQVQSSAKSRSDFHSDTKVVPFGPITQNEFFI